MTVVNYAVMNEQSIFSFWEKIDDFRLEEISNELCLFTGEETKNFIYRISRRGIKKGAMRTHNLDV